MRSLRTLLTIFAVLVPIAWLAHIYPALPSVIPNHYDSHGVPHRFAHKGTLWLLAAVSVLLTTGLLILSRLPRLFNLPAPAGDPRRPIFEQLASDMLGWLAFEIALMMDLTLWSLVQTALHRTSSFDLALTLPVLVVAGTAAWFLVRLRFATHPQTPRT